MSDNIALITFVEGYVEDGMGKDGLPNYRPTVRIIKDVPPLTKVEYEATDNDFAEFPEPYKLFQKLQQAKGARHTSTGYPLALWPVCTPAALAMLSARDIFTIEQLAKIRTNDTTIPAEIRELAGRAQKMMELSSQVGKFEQIIRDKDGQLEAQKEQIDELRMSLKHALGEINSLKARVA